MIFALDVALYLHRVRAPGHGLSIDAATLFEVLRFLDGQAASHITVSFDDGYADAVQWVDENASRWPRLQFLVNVCPQKLERRAGFRWDVGDDLAREPDIDRENARADLIAVGDQLATVDAVAALRRHRNVRLGNHSNCHLPLSALGDDDATRELEQSTTDFERLFGARPEDFAFPFGFPNTHFHLSHVETLRRLGYTRIWSTRESPMAKTWQTPGAVLPRIHLLGEWSAAQMIGWIRRRTMIYRLRRALRRSQGELPL